MASISVFPLITSIILVMLACQIYANTQQSNYCASVFTDRDYKGFRLNITTVTSDHRWNYIRHHNLIPNSVKVKTNCALTIFDSKGNIQTIQDNITDLEWSSRNPLHLSCCQCEDCDSFKEQNLECARMFQYEKCSSCIGSHVDLKDGQETREFRLLHNQVSSVAVREGCSLQVSYQLAYAGLKLNLQASLQTGDNFLESQGLFSEQATVRIQNAKCACNTFRQQSKLDQTNSMEVEVHKVEESIKKFMQPVKMAPRETIGSKESSSSGSTEMLSDHQDVSQSDEDTWPIY
ncbi:hypothetical protein Ocin01_09104 [Orchesella cincta]|uniref:Uncharacterized protein n=1 Tax=Orchesella cincta TaxID=48709 RepID=A0A1D2MX82_ORCCI|nr:hypothetical protein Ocin01_09104 [Orchesella cincta]